MISTSGGDSKKPSGARQEPDAQGQAPAALSREKRQSSRWLGEWLLSSEFQPDPSTADVPRLEGLLEPALVLTMVASLGAGLVDLARHFVAGWGTYLLLPLICLASLEALIYWWRLARAAFHPREWLVLLLPLALVAKFGPYLFVGWDRLIADACQWWRSPLDFFDPLFLLTCLLLVGSFRVTLDCAHDLSGLRVQPGELIDRSGSAAAFYSRADYIVDHLTPMKRLAERFLWGGALLVFISTLAAADPARLLTLEGAQELFTFARPPVTASFASVILYLAAGLLLMTRSQFLRRRTLWTVEEVPFEANIGRRWLWSGTGLLFLAVALALLAPVYYSLALHEVFSAALSVVHTLFFWIAAAIFLVLSVLLWPLRFLLGESSLPVEPRATPEAPRSTESVAGGLPDFLLPLLFWLVALAAIVYVARVVWLRRRQVVRLLPRHLSWSSLWTALLGLWRLFWRASRALGDTVGAGLVSLVRRPGPKVRGLILSHRPFRSMGPRELVQYFYVSMVEHATRAGHPRRPDQTPWEYAVRLRERAPELEPDLEELTDSFLWARFSHHYVGVEHSSWARRCWQTIRRKLKAQSRRRASS